MPYKYEFFLKIKCVILRDGFVLIVFKVITKNIAPLKLHTIIYEICFGWRERRVLLGMCGMSSVFSSTHFLFGSVFHFSKFNKSV